MFDSGFPLAHYNYQPNLPTHFALLQFKKKRRARSILTSQLSNVTISILNVKKSLSGNFKISLILENQNPESEEVISSTN
jgi:hypothetical protein